MKGRYSSSAEIVYLMEQHVATKWMSKNGWLLAYNAVITFFRNASPYSYAT
jgi:hypothetical protein